MRPKMPDDISKPLQNSFIHTGHGSAFGDSWGSPAYIDEMYLKNPMEPPDVLGIQIEPKTTPLNFERQRTLQKTTTNCFPKIHQSTEKQFNYKKLTNERTVKSKPQRPPQPKIIADASKEGLLIDISPEGTLSVSPQPTSPRPNSRNISLLDEPIDVPEEAQFWTDDSDVNGPPPYQQPPAYCNTTTLEQTVEDDPFDTSKVFNVQQMPLQAVFPEYSTCVKGDIANRSVNLHSSNSVISVKNTNLASSVSVVAPLKDMAIGLGEKENSALDKKLVEELESLNLSKGESSATQIPMIQPPPASLKVRKSNELLLKNTNTEAAAKSVNKDDHMMTLNEYMARSSSNLSDTTTVFNRLWYQNAVVQNGNMPKVNNIVAATTSHENISEFGQFRCNQPILHHQNGDNSLYNNQTVFNNPSSSTYYSTTNSCNLYASQLATYGSYSTVPGYRQYSEVPAESVYSEIPEYFYSQVPDETLKPHRPAPTSPLVMVGQPQSMQQIQRKLQQGQVIVFFSFMVEVCEVVSFVAVECGCRASYDTGISE